MRNFKNLLAVAIFLIAASAFGQGVTTSSLSGKVVDDKGEALPGATIVAVHTPTGTRYGNSTDFDGFYRLSNMRVGGPYKVTVSFIGYKNYEETNLFLTLGQNRQLNVTLQESSSQLEEIVVTAYSDGVINGNKTGSETTIDLRQINATPAASRSIADFVRLTPQVQISEGNDGFSISVAGQNNRYNSIYIDGAVNNDIFGLAGSGTNGGQTGVNPFSVDAIESFQVNLAPFDVKISGFTGAAISAVTRSGTNNFEASAYSFFRNEGLAGKTPAVLETAERERLDEFTALTYGVRVGGPIIKDKLFFFVNVERQDDEIPAPFQLSQYGGNSDAADIQRLRDHVLNTYGYNIGTFENAISSLVSNKITARLDWNINDKHKLTGRYSYVDADNLEARPSDFNDLQFQTGTELFVSKTNSISLEWNYQGKKTSNSLIVGYTRVRDDRDPEGDPFPSVIIGDGFNPFFGDGIFFGAERFSTANLLNTDIFTITNNFQIYSGKHTITLGTHNEFASAKNLFFASNFGFYRYDSIDDFIANTNLLDYDRGYSLLSPGAGDSSSGAAEFNTAQLGFYVQDDIQFTDDFKMSFGLRFDIPIWEDGIANDDFNTRVAGQLGSQLRGARVGQGIDAKVHFSPRVGFNWNVNGENKTQIRGGIGVFTSRLPLVWPGGTYNNNGVTGGFFSGDAGDGITFNPDVNNQPVGAIPGTGQTGGNVDLFAPNFTLPQIAKYNLIWDQRLPNGFSFTVDGTYQKTLSQVFYENLNVPRQPSGFIVDGDGGSGRPYYDRSFGARPISGYERVILASNTNEGDSWNTTFSLRKNHTSEFVDVFSMASYSYGDATSIFDGTSSQNSSQWRNVITEDGKNQARIGRSDFAQGHRVLVNTSVDLKWNENFKTTIGLLYDGTQGQPFSYIYNGEMLNDDSRDNALFFVPQRASDVNLVPYTDGGGNVVSVATQQAALDAFIDGNDYLRSRRGQFTERNGDWGRWSHVVDLRIVQDIKLKGKNNHTLQLTADIFNFTNLINKNWGVRYFGQTTSVLNVEDAPFDTGGRPTFTFDPSRVERVDNDVDDRGLQSSRWQAQLGIRYTFN